jgi:AmmeMemoRadiSam system protein B
MIHWYPQNKEQLNAMLDSMVEVMKSDIPTIKQIHGIVVPHAGFEYSGAVAGHAYAHLKKPKKAVVLGPSHYEAFEGVKTLKDVETPLGQVSLFGTEAYDTVEHEHSVENQIPFLQKINPHMQILPLVVGEITDSQAKEIAEHIADIDAVHVFSTDLSHFKPYNSAVLTDKASLKILEANDVKNWEKIDACGKYPLRVMMHLCKKKNWKPHLLEYKNSGDVTGDKSSVVGYAGLLF